MNKTKAVMLFWLILFLASGAVHAKQYFMDFGESKSVEHCLIKVSQVLAEQTGMPGLIAEQLIEETMEVLPPLDDPINFGGRIFKRHAFNYMPDGGGQYNCIAMRKLTGERYWEWMLSLRR